MGRAVSTFKSAIGVCGLSQQQAAEFLEVGLGTIKDWSSGRANPPRGVWVMLANLFEQIQDAADGAADVMALDGIDPRSYNNIQADIRHDALPTEGATNAAGAMALLMAIADQIEA